MTRLQWDQPGEKRFEAGVDRGVFYLKNAPGVPWNGLTNVSELSSGGEHTPLHYDGVKYLDVVGTEDFQATISAFTYPDELQLCEGIEAIAPGLLSTRQPRRTFNLAYRTSLGNDLVSTDFGYKLHLIYNAKILPATYTYGTRAEQITATNFSWNIHAVPPRGITGIRPTAHLIIDSTEVSSNILTSLESVLYGDENDDPYFPDQQFVVDLLATGTLPPYEPLPGPGEPTPPIIIDGGAP